MERMLIIQPPRPAGLPSDLHTNNPERALKGPGGRGGCDMSTLGSLPAAGATGQAAPDGRERRTQRVKATVGVA